MKFRFGQLGLGMAVMTAGCCVAEAQSAAYSAARAEINGGITIVESAKNPTPVTRATDDLAADFAKVFGQTPKRVQSFAEAGPVVLWIGEAADVPSGVNCAKTTATESFALSVTNQSLGPTARRVVCLTGADIRGTIYAVYEFSQSVLGIDPMYLWTDKQPAKRTAILLPTEFTHSFSGPVFKYRGFFPNDEDLLTGWVPAAKGEHTGISLKTWDMVFETTLRLKGNIVVPGTWIFPDDAQVEAASKRGLIVNQHHAIPLGVNVARWPKDVPYNLSTNPEILDRKSVV